MSPKTRKEKVETPRAPRVTEAKPPGRTPSGTVVSRHGSGLVTRHAKGFSFGELSAAGISLGAARRWGVQIDRRRRSTLNANVVALKGWAVLPPQKPVKEGELKRLEEEVVKVEKEVEREIKKEGAKAKKGVKKVEKEIVAKVEKPVKARQRKKKVPKE